jgi:hypothetical protein
MHYIL